MCDNKGFELKNNQYIDMPFAYPQAVVSSDKEFFEKNFKKI